MKRKKYQRNPESHILTYANTPIIARISMREVILILKANPASIQTSRMRMSLFVPSNTEASPFSHLNTETSVPNSQLPACHLEPVSGSFRGGRLPRQLSLPRNDKSSYPIYFNARYMTPKIAVTLIKKSPRSTLMSFACWKITIGIEKRIVHARRGRFRKCFFFSLVKYEIESPVTMRVRIPQRSERKKA